MFRKKAYDQPSFYTYLSAPKQEMFFILANPRSGSSLLRSIMNSHSRIVVPPECGFALWYAEKYTTKNRFSYHEYEEFAYDVINAKKFETWGVSKKNILDMLVRRKPTTYKNMIDCVYLAYAESRGKNVSAWGDKNNYYIEKIEAIKHYFPESKFVALIRDGRDVAASYRLLENKKIESRYKPNLPSKISTIAESWCANALKIQELVSDECDVHVVRYEDILENPAHELDKLFSYLGFSYEPSVLQFYENNDEPNDFMQWKEKLSGKLDPCVIGKHANVLKENEVKCFNKIAGKCLRIYNYL